LLLKSIGCRRPAPVPGGVYRLQGHIEPVCLALLPEALSYPLKIFLKF